VGIVQIPNSTILQIINSYNSPNSRNSKILSGIVGMCAIEEVGMSAIVGIKQMPNVDI
jgi:hypothetical protein